MTDFSAPLAYRATSLETAACIWEAILEFERIGDAVAGDAAQEARGAAICAAREAIGSSGLRLVAIGWTDAVDAAWQAADTDNGRVPAGGEYGGAFDWEFVPNWIAANIDWSNPHAPSIRPAAPVADLLDITAERLAVRGYQAGALGGGAQAMFRTFRHPGGDRISIVVATNRAGSDMPADGDWRLGIARGEWPSFDAAVTSLESVPGAVLDDAAAFAESIARNLVFGGRN